MEANRQAFQGILSALIHILSALLKDFSPSEVNQMILNIVKKKKKLYTQLPTRPTPSALAPLAKTPIHLSSAYPNGFLCSLPSALSLTHHLLLYFPVSRLST